MIWLRNPTALNDPYEFSYNVNIDEVLRQNYNDKFNIFLKELSCDEELVKIFDNIKSYNQKIEKLLELKKITNEQLDNFENRYIGVINDSIKNTDTTSLFKVSSFCENNDSLLMWSHYANQHTGLCIEYDLQKLSIEDPLAKSLYPVIYTKDMFDITEYYLDKVENRNINYLIPGMLTKSTEWEYEKEWRIVVCNDAEKGCDFHMPKPKAIYLGTKFPVDNLKVIYGFCCDNNIDLYRIEMHKSKYQLEKTKIV